MSYSTTSMQAETCSACTGDCRGNDASRLRRSTEPPTWGSERKNIPLLLVLLKYIWKEKHMPVSHV